MKKVTASIVAIMLMISVLAMSVSAATTTKSEEVLKELNSTASYLTTAILAGDQDKVFINDRAVIAILTADVKNEQLEGAYTSSLKKSLDANNGKMIYQGAESAGSYAGAITILKMMGKDPTNFEGYNLVKSFNDLGKDAIAGQSNPYMLAYTLQFVSANSELITEKTVATALVEALKALYVEDAVKGTGYDYWGITMDTSATIVPALFPYYEKDADVKNQIDKSMAWVLAQYSEQGYNYSAEYPGINGNSTGLALSVLSEMGDLENAEKAYKALGNFKSEDTLGAYGYSNKTANVGATINVITGLSAYYTTLKASEKQEETTTEVTTEAITETTTEVTTSGTTTTAVKTTTTTVAGGKGDASVPKTGTSASPIAIVTALVAAGGIIAITRKKITV